MEQKLDVAMIYGRMWEVVSRSRGPVVLFVAVFFALSFLENHFSEEAGMLLVSGIVSLAAYYLFVRSLLQNAGLKRVGEGGGFGAYFAVAILSGLGMTLGFILLVIPGLVLMVRWLPAEAMVLSEDRGASDSLAESWAMTAEHFWPLLSVMLLGFVPYVAVAFGLGIGAEFYNFPSDGAGGEIWLALVTVATAIYPVYSISLSVATYWLLRGDRRTIEDVFA